MKVKDIINQDIDVDVYSDYTDELATAFVGPIHLTSDGEEKFAEALNYDINLNEEEGCCIVHCDNDRQLAKATKFFLAAAGWCSENDYNKWFE